MNSDSKKIPLLNLKRQHEEYKRELLAAMNAAVDEGQYIMGREVSLLEEELAEYLGSNSCIGVASGTDALVIALRTLAIKAGGVYFKESSEVITTAFTFTATGGTILRSGAKPVFVDIDPETFNLAPEQVAAAVSGQTVGMIPVHLYGQPCPMDDMLQIAKDNSLFVVEDVAQAFGAVWRDSKLGSMGDFGAFSFFPSKNLGCLGDGGMLATCNAELAEIAAMLRTQGGKDKYNVEFIGYNSRLDTLQAAVLRVKFKHLERLNKMRRKIAATYTEGLGELSWLKAPVEIEKGHHIYHQYTVRILNGRRDFIQERLKEKGIVTAVYYPIPLHQMKLFKGRAIVRGDLIHTDQACKEVLSLPIEPLMDNEEVAYVIETMQGMKM